LATQAASLDYDQLAAETQVGVLTLRDIVAQLVRPGRDPRESLPAPIFKQGILKLEDLAAGMELQGTVLNVVDFGAFVDIGLKDSGLVHVSQLSEQFVKDPHDVVCVGDIVNVWVLDVDKQRRRVRLSMVDPARRREAHKPREARPPKPATEGQPRPERRPQRATSGGPPQGRRPHGKGRPQRQTYVPQQPKPKPKPIVPISDEMKKGKAPLRTFGDLMQFWQLKQDDAPPKPEESGEGPAASGQG
jgi:uncharacterized protein